MGTDERKRELPDTLLVWDGGDAWDGIAINPDGTNNEAVVQAWLESIDDKKSDVSEIIDSDCWVRVEFNRTEECYYHQRYDREFLIDDIFYLPTLGDK
jgi:hypothetical protein